MNISLSPILDAKFAFEMVEQTLKRVNDVLSGGVDVTIRGIYVGETLSPEGRLAVENAVLATLHRELREKMEVLVAMGVDPSTILFWVPTSAGDFIEFVRSRQDDAGAS